MATAPDSIRRFEEADIFVASPALTARRLRETASSIALLWLASGKGGGENSPQVEPAHLTNFILAQGANLPVDAANAVIALRDLQVTATETFMQTEPVGVTVPSPGATMDLTSLAGQTLGEVLDVWIASAADPGMRASLAAVTGSEWQITLCADPAFATISQRVWDRLEIVTFGQKGITNRAQRLVALPFKVITIAGELWQDTCEKRGESFPSAASETESADILAGTSAPPVPPNPHNVRTSDRPDSPNTAGSKRSRARNQPRTPKQ